MVYIAVVLIAAACAVTLKWLLWQVARDHGFLTLESFMLPVARLVAAVGTVVLLTQIATQELTWRGLRPRI